MRTTIEPPKKTSVRASRKSIGQSGTKATIQPLTKRNAWKALAAHSHAVQQLHLRDLFAQDPKRGERLTLEAAGLYLDYSKNRITDQTLKLLFQLATESGLKERIEA